MAKRITVLWMTAVPTDEDGTHDYDSATWASKEFPGDAVKQARAFARKVAATNDYRQAWIQFESAPRDDSPEWRWERDYSADEIVEAAA